MYVKKIKTHKKSIYMNNNIIKKNAPLLLTIFSFFNLINASGFQNFNATPFLSSTNGGQMFVSDSIESAEYNPSLLSNIDNNSFYIGGVFGGRQITIKRSIEDNEYKNFHKKKSLLVIPSFLSTFSPGKDLNFLFGFKNSFNLNLDWSDDKFLLNPAQKVINKKIKLSVNDLLIAARIPLAINYIKLGVGLKIQFSNIDALVHILSTTTNGNETKSKTTKVNLSTSGQSLGFFAGFLVENVIDGLKIGCGFNLPITHLTEGAAMAKVDESSSEFKIKAGFKLPPYIGATLCYDLDKLITKAKFYYTFQSTLWSYTKGFSISGLPKNDGKANGIEFKFKNSFKNTLLLSFCVSKKLEVLINAGVETGTQKQPVNKLFSLDNTRYYGGVTGIISFNDKTSLNLGVSVVNVKNLKITPNEKDKLLASTSAIVFAVGFKLSL